jgi:hypothetical protein
VAFSVPIQVSPINITVTATMPTGHASWLPLPRLIVQPRKEPVGSWSKFVTIWPVVAV